MNPWAASDRYTETEATRLTWLWEVLYDAIRDMLATLPTPIRIPHLDTETAADTLTAVRADLEGQDLPDDIRQLADRALTDAVLALNTTGTHRRHLTTEAQARVRAVVAYLGVGPEDLAVPDTLEELTT